MTTLTVNQVMFPVDWVRTPLTEWFLRNQICNVNQLSALCGITWDTSRGLLFGRTKNVTFPTRSKLMRFGVPLPVITAHMKAVATTKAKRYMSRQISQLTEQANTPVTTVAHSSSTSNDKVAELIKSNDEIKKRLRSVGSILLSLEAKM
jgi:hypothetical protein